MTPQTTKDIIFNDCLIDWGSPLVITEGPFDMMTAGRNVVPLQGKMLKSSSLLFSSIVTSGVPVYLALDSDAQVDQLAMAHLLYRYGVSVRLVGLAGHKDVSEMGRTAFLDEMSTARHYTDTDRIRILCELL